MRANTTIACLLSVLSFLLAALPAADGSPDPHATAFRKPMPAGQAADALRHAVATGDEDTIRKLAGASWPDPFEVAARMLFPMLQGGKPTDADRDALRRFANAASDETGVRAFIEFWLAADDEVFARERQFWRVTAHMTERMKAENYASAFAVCEEAMPLLEATAHSHQGPWVRGLRATTLRRLGRADEAVAALEDLAARLGRRRWPAYEGVVRLWLAEACIGAGRGDKRVLAECDRAERLLTEARNWKYLLSALGYKKAALSRLGRLAEAEETAYRAMVVARETGREPEFLQGTLYLADVASRMGRAETAATLRRGVFVRARDADFPDAAAWAADDLVLSEMAAGRTAAAMTYGDWLEDSFSRITNLNVRADAALVLGDLAAWRGRDGAALAHYTRALETHRGVGSPGRLLSLMRRIVGLGGEAGLRAAVGAEGVAELRRTAQLAATRSEAIPILADWSRAELRLGHTEEALRVARRAQAHAEKNPGASDAHLAALQLARIQVARKQWDEAIALLEPLVDALPKSNGYRLMGLDRLGVSYCGQGRWKKATQSFREAVARKREGRSGVAARDALTHREAEHVMATRGVMAASEWYGSGGGDAALEAVWWFREMAGGRLLASAIAGGPPQADGGGDDSHGLTGALEAVESAHGRLMVAVLEGDESAQRDARQGLQSAHEGLARIEARAARRSGGHVQLPDPVPLGDLRAALAADTALLAYALGPEGVYALALTSEGGRATRLGTLDETRKLVAGWRRLASTPEGPEAKLAARLYDRLVRPFEDLLASRPNWIVMPDGALCGVPLDAWIRTTRQGKERLIDTHALTYAHGHGVLEALAARQAKRPAGRGLVALGNPAYPVTKTAAHDEWQMLAALGRGGLHMPLLPASGIEARTVAALYPQDQRTLLLKEDAARSHWLAAISSRAAPLDCVHLACHGLVDDRLPSLSGLVFANGEILTAERLQETRVLADLVVLSACQSGGETVSAGEGLLGLTRAFFRAGVSRVLCTTWQVADASTAELMARFHEARREADMTDAAALRSARRALMRDPATSHPYYWAGFQLWGARER